MNNYSSQTNLRDTSPQSENILLSAANDSNILREDDNLNLSDVPQENQIMTPVVQQPVTAVQPTVVVVKNPRSWKKAAIFALLILILFFVLVHPSTYKYTDKYLPSIMTKTGLIIRAAVMAIFVFIVSYFFQ